MNIAQKCMKTKSFRRIMHGEKTGKSTNWPCLSLFLAAMGSECRFQSIKFSVYGQKRKWQNVSVDAEQALRFRLDENGALMWTRLDNVLGVSLLFAALQCLVPRGLFLESPETFRAYFGWHNSLCVFKTKGSRGTKLCSYFYFHSLYNIWKDQLYRISRS